MDKGIIESELKTLEAEIIKKQVDIHLDKKKFITELKNGLGDKLVQEIQEGIEKELEKRKKKPNLLKRIYQRVLTFFR